MNGSDEQTLRTGDSFTITRTEAIKLREGDMITDPATGVTYYRQDGEIRTVGTRAAESDPT